LRGDVDKIRSDITPNQSASVCLTSSLPTVNGISGGEGDFIRLSCLAKYRIDPSGFAQTEAGHFATFTRSRYLSSDCDLLSLTLNFLIDPIPIQIIKRSEKSSSSSFVRAYCTSAVKVN
jgi:hypothetical protein